MAQTLVSLMTHVIFSTKNREPLIPPGIAPELFAYIGGILKNNESRLLSAGGTSDHLHLLLSQSKNFALSSLMKDVKKDSSRWIKTKGRAFRDFHWQDGYGAFSIGISDVATLRKYIAGQKEHHRKRSFQEELVHFLEEYGMEYDERIFGINSTLSGSERAVNLIRGRCPRLLNATAARLNSADVSQSLLANNARIRV